MTGPAAPRKHADPVGDAQAEIARLYHELQVHQAELEEQNEALRGSHAALEAERRRYAELFHLAPIGYLVLAEDGAIVEANRAAAELLGVGTDALPGHQIADFCDAPGRDALTRLLGASPAPDMIQSADVTFAFPGDKVRIVDLRVSRDPESGIRRTALTDVTELRRAETALIDSELRYRMLAENASDVVALLGSTRRFEWVSPSIERALGYRPDELIGRPAVDILHPDDLAGLTARREDLRGRQVDGVMRCRTAAGAWRWMSIVSTEIVRPDGGTARVVGVQDVDAEVRAREALERSRVELAEAQRIAHVGSWRLGLHAETVEWSEEMFRIWGLAPGRPAPSIAEQEAFTDPETAARRTAAIRRSLAAGEPYEMEYTLRRPDGRLRRLAVRGEPVRAPDGTPLGLRGTTTDVTDARAEEAARARRIQNRADYRVRAGHTLRTSLSIIAGWAELLSEEDDDLDPAVRRAGIEAIARNARALLASVRGVLDEAAETARIGALQPDPLDVAEVVTAIVSEFAGRSEAGRVTAEPAAGVIALATRPELETVLRHLLENAVRYAGPSGSVEVRSETTEDGRVRISVRDDGPGIAPGAELFVAFAAGSASGHGLGLHVVKTLVEAMGGEVEAGNRTDGPGAELIVTLRTPG